MKTSEEILKRIKDIEKDDAFGFQRGDLIFKLPFKMAKEFLKPEAKEEDYNQEPCDRDSIVAGMLDYMPFAWEKANDCRGLSASRSMSHYAAWTWLVGEDFGDLLDYEHYGKENLIRICDHYGWDHKQWDDDIRTNG